MSKLEIPTLGSQDLLTERFNWGIGQKLSTPIHSWLFVCLVVGRSIHAYTTQNRRGGVLHSTQSHAFRTSSLWWLYAIGQSHYSSALAPFGCSFWMPRCKAKIATRLSKNVCSETQAQPPEGCQGAKERVCSETEACALCWVLAFVNVTWCSLASWEKTWGATTLPYRKTFHPTGNALPSRSLQSTMICSLYICLKGYIPTL